MSQPAAPTSEDLTEDQIRSLDPAVAAAAAACDVTLGPAAWRTLVIACRDGGRVTQGTRVQSGVVERVTRAAISLLVQRGLLVVAPAGPSTSGAAAELSSLARCRLARLWCALGARGRGP